jgi:hypothetical protein
VLPLALLAFCALLVDLFFDTIYDHLADVYGEPDLVRQEIFADFDRDFAHIFGYIDDIIEKLT